MILCPGRWRERTVSFRCGYALQPASLASSLVAGRKDHRQRAPERTANDAIDQIGYDAIVTVDFAIEAVRACVRAD